MEGHRLQLQQNGTDFDYDKTARIATTTKRHALQLQQNDTNYDYGRLQQKGTNCNCDGL
jgi:hypothetical protein